MKFYVSILGLLAFFHQEALSASIQPSEVMEVEWEAFKVQYGKSYDSIEDNYRRKIFMENKRLIAEHNIRTSEGKHNFTLEINQFGDMLRSEFTRKETVLKESFVHFLCNVHNTFRDDEWIPTKSIKFG